MSVTRTNELDPFLNLLTAMEKGGIERQESRGQNELARSQQLPRNMSTDGVLKFLESVGFHFDIPQSGDSLFYDCIFPVGWTIKPTDHPMWSDLIDPTGAKRASIFYKAAFYDRDAHMRMLCRYQYYNEPVSGWNSVDTSRDQTDWIGVVMDNETNTRLFETEIHTQDSLDNWHDRRRVWLENNPGRQDIDYFHIEKLPGEVMSAVTLGPARKWLEENYPDHRDPFAYWTIR